MGIEVFERHLLDSTPPWWTAPYRQLIRVESLLDFVEGRTRGGWPTRDAAAAEEDG